MIYIAFKECFSSKLIKIWFRKFEKSSSPFWPKNVKLPKRQTLYEQNQVFLCTLLYLSPYIEFFLLELKQKSRTGRNRNDFFPGGEQLRLKFQLNIKCQPCH